MATWETGPDGLDHLVSDVKKRAKGSRGSGSIGSDEYYEATTYAAIKAEREAAGAPPPSADDAMRPWRPEELP